MSSSSSISCRLNVSTSIPCFTVEGLTLGPEKSLYSVKEDEGSLEVCMDVLLGTIPSSETYTISYSTVNGAAEGMPNTITLYISMLAIY